MTIYILEWKYLDQKCFEASSSYTKSAIRHKSIREEMKSDLDMDVEPENVAIVKHTVKTQNEVIDLINSLNKEAWQN